MVLRDRMAPLERERPADAVRPREARMVVDRWDALALRARDLVADAVLAFITVVVLRPQG